MNRRTFLHRTGLACVGASVVPASRMWAKPPGPNGRIALGFIGLGVKAFDGMWGSVLQSLIAYPHCRIVAVCDVDRRLIERARTFVNETYGDQDCTGYVDFRDLLARRDIDAVVIATPDHWHAVQTIEACKAGKDVYCEKPLSLTVEEGRAMVGAARRYDRVVQTGSQSRSSARIQFACEAVQAGRIGEVKRVTAACGGPPVYYNLPEEPTPSGMEWDLWVGPSAWRPFNRRLHPCGFRAFREFAGGGMADWGSHHFDIVHWALGEDYSGPSEVLPPNGEDRKRLTFRYASGVELEHVNFDDPAERENFFGVTFHGTDGTIQIQGISGEGSFEPAALASECKAEVAKATDLRSNRGHYENWLECIVSRRRPVADVEIGCRSVTVSHLGNIGYWMNRPLRWDAGAERFIGDAEANRLLGRSMREPWTI